ncbi:hypothetical protein TCCBUS3UF1_16950 [Thermus sp. CCB_US3_UF1]|uniref:DUF3084 domain-containing protein n=1 Tax=Thermus sp. CCB_US3_UF1 TaxID=1111069 RepID=UPI0002389427|nr:DUF3084 domain-containing protein [Thermus sp. CCB_US3_UF1]AEV16736.1 hypothetical protein TCCBUS3UF1_16950 [Thermus sp. CCB_US3_UF1]
MTFWALLTLILLLSALVAYLGDKVAKWAGKRHYRLFGLRPRQTATLIAVATGVGIALLSYLGFLLVFREAREVILEAEAVRQERDRLRSEREVLLKAKEAMEGETARALAELNALRAERKRLYEALEGAEALRKRLEAEAQALEGQVAALQGERRALLRERERLLEGQEALSQLLAEKNRELGHRTRELAGLEARVRALQGEAKRLEGEKERLLRESQRLEGDLALLQAQLEEARRQRQALAQEVVSLKEALLRSRQELRQTEERVRSLLAQAEALQGERGQLAQNLARLAQGFYLGEVRLGQEEGQALLQQVAERRALLQGFRGAELLGGATGPGLAVLEGAGYREGRLLVRVRFYPERKAFAQGEVLAARTFRLSTPARHQEALEALGQEVRGRLLEAGFPPEYATFPSAEELARGLALLQGRKGVVRVGVVAAKDLWTAERPLLYYTLLGGPPGPEVPIPTRQVP